MAQGQTLEESPCECTDADVWGLKFIWRKRKIHRAFMMDDLRWILARRKGRETIAELNEPRIPLVCLQHYDELPLSEPYPLDEVLVKFGITYFTNTLSYMIALAVHVGYERIELYGTDMGAQSAVDVRDPRIRHQEESWSHERECMNFWLGVAVGRGIQIFVPERSSLVKHSDFGESNLYGYTVGPKLQRVRQEILSRE